MKRIGYKSLKSAASISSASSSTIADFTEPAANLLKSARREHMATTVTEK